MQVIRLFASQIQIILVTATISKLQQSNGLQAWLRRTLKSGGCSLKFTTISYKQTTICICQLSKQSTTSESSEVKYILRSLTLWHMACGRKRTQCTMVYRAKARAMQEVRRFARSVSRMSIHYPSNLPGISLRTSRISDIHSLSLPSKSFYYSLHSSVIVMQSVNRAVHFHI